MIKRIFIGIGVIVISLLVIYFDLVIYGIGQGIGQFKVLYYARPIEEMLADSTVDDATKEKLLMVGEMKKFAINKIGLAQSENYTTVYDQGGKPILWVVRACEPYMLKNKEWSFPIVGTVSYKGFFNLDKAKKLRNQLDEEGFDTYIREVSAWSTLGWFKDPLMSGTLADSEGGLANTIIHELTHATIFVKDSLTFNENLASFIGDKGAELYLAEIYGQKGEELLSYMHRKEDRAKFSQHFILGTRKLDSLYKSIQEFEEEEKKLLKEKMILKIISALDTVSFQRAGYKGRFKDKLPNNAFFMSFLLYRSGQNQLDSVFNNLYNADLLKMVDALKELHPKQ